MEMGAGGVVFFRLVAFMLPAIFDANFLSRHNEIAKNAAFTCVFPYTN